MPTAARRRSAEPWMRRLFLPAYTVADAARYARTSVRTVAYWHYGGSALGPALPGRPPRKPLSYLQLVEVAFVATFRRLGVSLPRIRQAREYLAQQVRVEFPFAQLRLQTEGVHVLMELQQIERDSEIGHLVVADEAGQMAWRSVVAERFAEFDYEKGLAVVWHPAGRQSAVVIDPRISFGAPTVRGVPTWVLKGRWMAQETIEDIEEDFGLEREAILQALEFEGTRKAA